MVLMGVAALLVAACGSLFDSPPGKESVHEEAALKRMEKLATTTPEGAVGKAADAATNKARAVDITKRKKKDDPESGDDPQEDEITEWKEPRLSFERVKAEMPHLAVWGLDEATFLLDGKQIEPGKQTREGRIALIAPGHHLLQVKCPFDPPFSADFYLVKDDRIVLSGRCTSGKRVATRKEKGN
jgi:hypothetical protein